VKLPTLQLPEELVDQMQADVSLAYHVWDVAWCISQKSNVRLLDERLATLAAYAKAGGNEYYTFNPRPGQLDIIDLASGDMTLLEYAK